MGNLDAWTKVGDRIEGGGKWAVYRLSTKSPFRELKSETFDDVERAQRAYQRIFDELRQGGVYMVNPEGVVAACMWIPPTPRYS